MGVEILDVREVCVAVVLNHCDNFCRIVMSLVTKYYRGFGDPLYKSLRLSGVLFFTAAFEQRRWPPKLVRWIETMSGLHDEPSSCKLGR